MPKGAFRSDILHYMENHIGENVYVDDISQAANCTREQAQAAINNMRHDAFPIESIVAGNVWRYTGETAKAQKQSKRMFEELAVTKSGDILIQDLDGVVYRAVELP